jgi:hypothetical protein
MEWYEKVHEELYDDYNYCVVSRHGSRMNVDHKKVTNNPHEFTNIWTLKEEDIPWLLKTYFASRYQGRLTCTGTG